MRLSHLLAPLLSLVLVAFPALAQQVDTNTSAGRARIIENADGTKDVMIGTTRVVLPEDAFVAFFDGRVGDLLLVVFSPGGNACNGFYTWVHTTPGDIRRSPEFGTCAARGEITWDAETVRVTMPSVEPGKGDVTYIYDGKGHITTRQAGLADSGVTRLADWAGRYGFDLVNAGEKQAQLRGLLGAANLLEVQRVMNLASPMQTDGNWIAGTGCARHACDTDRAAIAINLGDGRLLVALKTPMRGPVLWGNPNGPYPLAIKEVITMR